MNEFFFRTEDIPQSEILEYFVETKADRRLIDALKSRTPTILVGSRGVGKSFLLRVAERELLDSADVLPVYLSFNRASLIHTQNPRQFQHWMLARLCSRIIRALKKSGRLVAATAASRMIGGGNSLAKFPRVSEIADAFEESWKAPGGVIDTEGLPTVEDFRDAVEDLCADVGIQRFCVLFDEAAHIFRPAQQRQFFDLFRDLRSPYLTCNAAVYPGVTSFGEAFQPSHDATILNVERDVLEPSYVENMQEIVNKQAGSKLRSSMARHGENFAVVAFAASGNPRLLLKTLATTPNVSSSEINERVREFYRSDIWTDHSSLAERYSGHRALVDWGRTFLEGTVLPDLKSKNENYLRDDKKTTAFFWIHRDAPSVVREALRLLAYTGIVSDDATGIRATRSQIGTRYRVNLGCLLALEPTPAATGYAIAMNLTPKRMSEFGVKHGAFDSLVAAIPDFVDEEGSHSERLVGELSAPVDMLDITLWQKEKLRELELPTVGDVLRSGEDRLKDAHYIGDVRARQIWNAAFAAILEYLSG